MPSRFPTRRLTNAAPSGVQLLRVELTAALFAGAEEPSEANAVLVAPSGAGGAYTASQAPITVIDPMFHTGLGAPPSRRFWVAGFADSRAFEILGGPTLQGAVLGKNVSSETMPTGAIVEITGDALDPDLGEIRHEGTKPTTTFAKQYMVNVFELEPGANGFFYTPGREVPVYYTGSPARADGFGPTAGEWFATENNPQIATVAAAASFNMFGGDTSLVMMHLVLPNTGIIKNSSGSSIAANTTGAFTLQKGTMGSEAAAGFNTIQMRNRGSIAFADTKIGFAQIINGQYYASPAECP